MISKDYDAAKKQLTIYAPQHFGHKSDEAFTQGFSSIEDEVTLYVINFKYVKYIDSSGLGLLLKLKEYAERHKAQVILTEVTGYVKEVLEMANYDKLFEMDE